MPVFLPQDLVLYLAVFRLWQAPSNYSNIKVNVGALVIGSTTVGLAQERERILVEAGETSDGSGTPDGCFAGGENVVIPAMIPLGRGTELSLYHNVSGNTVGYAVLNIYLRPS